tara:strand:+ start:2928 stop:3179 length:252 start_codon:yes stop_codon:yes gene_type:complete
VISKKRSQRITENNMQRIIDKIYDDLNELIDAVNSKDTVLVPDESVGKEGNIRIIRDPNGDSYKIQGRTSEGWASTSITLNEE